MPTYVYGCSCGQRSEVVHGMLATVAVSCPNCGGTMHRIPQASRINWAGFRTEKSPAVKQFLNGVEARREQYEEKRRNGQTGD
jgi:putative FmdB family regulatory protein